MNGIPSNPQVGTAPTCEASHPLRSTVRLERALRRLGQALAVAAGAVAFYFLFSQFCIQSVTVTGASMAPTLHDSERYLLNLWIYHVRTPHRGELVVFRDPTDRGLSVKRIVATEGDTVRVIDGVLLINGKPANEPYLAPGTVTLTPPSCREQHFSCQQGQYFLLGDNRNNSIDSRVYGPVPQKNIVGMVIR